MNKKIKKINWGILCVAVLLFTYKHRKCHIHFFFTELLNIKKVYSLYLQCIVWLLSLQILIYRKCPQTRKLVKKITLLDSFAKYHKAWQQSLCASFVPSTICTSRWQPVNLFGTIIRLRTRTCHSCSRLQNELLGCFFVAEALWRAALPGNAYLNCSVEKYGPETKNEHHTNWLSIASFHILLKVSCCNLPLPACP